MIEVVSPGVLTTIQDQGRHGYQHLGVPYSGCMDQQSADLANRIVGNDLDCALFEITLSGPTLFFNTSACICVTGGKVELPSFMDMNKVTDVNPGSEIKFGRIKKGARAYLAVRGGIDSALVLNSRSQYHGVTEAVRLVKHERLRVGSINSHRRSGQEQVYDINFDEGAIEVYKGPEYHLLSARQQFPLLHAEFTVSVDANRMGYRVKERVDRHQISILTSPVLPGTVQLPPSGSPLILMRDCQTTGGYPRVLQLTDQAINQLAQKRPGDKLKFKMVSY